MSIELIVTALVSLVVGLVSKIIFDWLRYGWFGQVRSRNPHRHGNPSNNPNGIFKDILTELREIKTTVLWSKQIQDNMDPATGQPRWYNTGLINEMKIINRLLGDALKLERKNRELLLDMRRHLMDGTDPNIGGN